MIDRDSIRSIIDQYTKYGWTLRRVLLSSKNSVDPAHFGGIEPVYSDIDAIWFTRRSRPDAEAWELRRLTGSPFALVEVITDATSPREREAVLKAAEAAMAGADGGPTLH